MSKIPRNIHFTFLSKEEPFPSLFTTCLETVKSLHPGWNIRVYNEDDARDILTLYFPQLYSVYYSYTHTVQRSDLLRVLLVYLYGGFYMDLDMLCLKSLEGLRDFSLVLGEEKCISEEEVDQLKLQYPLRIANYMFGSREKHPFWHCFLNKAVCKSMVCIQSENDILESTGPGLLTNVYHTYKREYPDITLLRNTDRRCLRPGHTAISCHFGNYAAHLHQGSWRWGVAYQDKHAALAEPDEHPLLQPPFSLQPFRHNNFFVMPFAGCLGKKGNVLHQLYRHFDVYPKANAGTLSRKDVTTFVLGNPFSYVQRLSPDCTNVLITVWDHYFQQHNPAEIINRYYKCCIVSGKHEKEMFFRAGVKVPIHVVEFGFIKPPRNFDSESDSPLHFTIGISSIQPGDDLFLIIEVCKRIKAGPIPELRLQLWEPFPGSLKKSTQMYIKRNSEWIDVCGGISNLSLWYSSIHCYLSISDNDVLYNGPATSLYMGVPAIVSQKYYYRAFTQSGYCTVIPGKKGIVTEASVEKAICEVFGRYEHCSELALQGAIWIEDKWNSEKCFYDIIQLLTSGKI